MIYWLPLTAWGWKDAGDWEFAEHEFMGGGRCGGGWCVACCGMLYVLAWLRHVAQVCFTCIQTVLCNEGRCEAWPGLIGTTLDGCKPCRFDRVASRGMEVGNKGWDAGQVVGTGMGMKVIGSLSWCDSEDGRG